MLRGLLTLMKSYGQKQMKRVKASPDKLLKAYKSGLSVPEIALHYKVSRSTAWRWLKKLNIDLTRVKYNRTRKPDYGKMASWLRLHGDIVLPKSIKEICLISGLSNDVVRSYFNRRQHLQVIRVRKYLKELFASDTLLVDMYNNRYHTKAIKSYTFKVDQFTFTANVKIILKYAGNRYLVLKDNFKN